MARLNKSPEPIRTHEGAVAKRINPAWALRRSVLACLLWESTFYEEGQEIASRIEELVPQVDPVTVGALAVEAREDMKLRHVPLLLVREMARHDKHKVLVAATLSRVIQRADELAEFLAIYWKDGKQPLSAQVKRGLATAFGKFNEYELAKYNRPGEIKLRDVLFLSHAKPKDEEQAAVWKRLIDGTLATPDTWEVALSGGADKKATFERLISEKKLGALALLRNLRNMEQAGCDDTLVRGAIREMKVERVLPFRFIAAARYAPRLEPELEGALFRCMTAQDKLKGRTILVLDVSSSMSSPLSDRSEMTRLDAACGLAILLREIGDDVRVFTFTDTCKEVPARRGFALRDAICSAQIPRWTYLGAAMKYVESKVDSYDRVICLTDEQSHDNVPNPKGKGYVINVAVYRNGVGYGPWLHIDGWSESVIRYIQQMEQIES